MDVLSLICARFGEVRLDDSSGIKSEADCVCDGNIVKMLSTLAENNLTPIYLPK